ncbi:MAG: bifunctional diaminohydroxyphosphoribosylaminopyrimidine deaminase/5-amino-6-(5-phosphoribosylamino)uracil reductase RibD [Elusimicrobiales bacterium]
MDRHEGYMARAIELARRGRYTAHPNPLVGAVLVKGGRVISEGAHLRYGGPHAEVNTLSSCKVNPAGAAIYVTLEPCSTYGKTPPCTELLIKSGIKEVYYGAKDVNPAHSGRGAAILRRAGIKVTAGVLGKECQALNPAFAKFMRTGLPYVTVKIAQSLDGRIADAAGRSRWISSPQSRLEAHKLRAEADAVLAGIGTVLADDPLLNVRGVKVRRQPWIVALDSSFRVPRQAQLFQNERVLIATTRKASVTAMKKFPHNARILVLPSEKGRVSLKPLLAELGKLGIAHVLVEGGGRVAGSFISEGLADRFICFVAPMIIGGTESKNSLVWPDELNAGRKELGLRPRLAAVTKAGPDFMLDLRFD